MASAIATVIASVLRFLTFRYPDSAIGIVTLGNIKAYIAIVVIWLGTAYLIDVVLNRFIKKELPKVLSYVFAAVTTAAGAYVTVRMYEHFGKNGSIKYIAATLVFAAGMLFSTALLKKDIFAKIGNIICIVEIILFGCLWFLVCATVNTFNYYSFGRLYNIYHSSAYIDTILNTYYGAPFMGIESEIYGHYGLLYIIPMKIFGPGTDTIGTMLGIMGALSIVFIGVSVMIAVKQPVLKVFSIGAIGLYGIFAYNIYWQNNPHRMFFPALFIMLFTAGTLIKKHRKALFFIGLIFSCAALIWNNETGILCAIGWGLYGGMALSGKHKNIIMAVPGIIISVAVSFGGALGIVNAYNLTHGGSAIGAGDYAGFQTGGFIAHLSTPIETGNLLYVHIILITVICALAGLKSIYIDENITPKAALALITGVFGLGMTTYFVNNSAGGTGILSMYFILAASVCASGAEFKKDLFSYCKCVLCIYASVIVFFGGVNGRFLLSQVKEERQAGAGEYASFREFAGDVENKIAPDTKGAGFGTSALFLEMDRDRGTRDFHINVEELDNAEHFIIILYDQTEFEGYELEEVFDYQSIPFGYYSRIG